MLACLAELELLSEKTDVHSGMIWSVAFSPDGTKIVSGSNDGTIKVWESGALLANAAGALRTLALGDPPSGWRFGLWRTATPPSGRRLRRRADSIDRLWLACA
jgi:WD40 repeat protein